MKSIITFFSLIFLCNLSAQTQSVSSLGMKIAVYQDWLYVSEVTPEYPAAKAGILVKDYITQINKINAYQMKIDEAVKLLDAAVGTKVNIQIFRNSKYYNYSLVGIDPDSEETKAEAEGYLDTYGFDSTNLQDSTAESIGIKINSYNGWLWVSKLSTGYPAESSGIKVGDYITKIGNVNVYQMKIDEAIKLLNADAGTTINIQTYRDGKYYDHSLVSRGQYSDQNLSSGNKQNSGQNLYTKKDFWEPVTAFPDNHFFPSYAWATSGWIDAPAEGVIGIRGGSLGVTIENTTGHFQLEISAPEIADETSYEFDIPLGALSAYNIYPNINYKWEKLRNITQPTPANVKFTLFENGKQIGQKNTTISVHSIYDCPISLIGTDESEVDLSYMFASYVNENDPVIDDLLREALNTGIVKQFAGNQEGDGGVWLEVTALWAVLNRRGITYSSVTTPSLGIDQNKLNAQKVRFPSDALKTSQANCIDGTVLFASLLRRIGIHSHIVLIPGHAFVGFDDSTGTSHFLETTMLATKVTEDNYEKFGITTDQVDFYKKNLSDNVFSSNEGSIYNFIACFNSATNEYNEAKTYIESRQTGYKNIDVDYARDKDNVMPISR